MAERWMPGVVHVPIGVNYRAGAMGAMVGMVLHHIVGSVESADTRFRTPGSGASAHFGVTFEGVVFQWVAVGDAAFHACQANYEGQVGVETESPAAGDVWAPLTWEQVASCANIARWLHAEHNMVLRVADPEDRRGVGYHSMCPGVCSAPHAWGQTGCPGAAVVAQRQTVVDLATTPPVPIPPVVARRKDRRMDPISWTAAGVEYLVWCDVAPDGRLIYRALNAVDYSWAVRRFEVPLLFLGLPILCEPGAPCPMRVRPSGDVEVITRVADGRSVIARQTPVGEWAFAVSD